MFDLVRWLNENGIKIIIDDAVPPDTIIFSVETDEDESSTDAGS